MKFVSNYMAFVKKKEEFRLSKLFQFFLMFYGFFLLVAGGYKFIITYKLDNTSLLLIFVGFLLLISGFVWNFMMVHKGNYKEIMKSDQKKFYTNITS